MRSVAIVPARGGSKRIPRKNIRLFLGEPVLGRVVEQLLAAKCFDEVMVSTDDREIAEVARAHGAAVPFMRSPGNSDDRATTAAVILEVLAAYARQGRQFERACCAYPTAVFVTAALLQEGFRLLDASGADSVVPVLRYSAPIERALRIDGGKLRMERPGQADTRTSDFAPAYHDAGQCYWFRIAAFLEQKTLYARHCAPLVLDPMQAQDIDTEDDWRIAEFKYAYLQARQSR